MSKSRLLIPEFSGYHCIMTVLMDRHGLGMTVLMDRCRLYGLLVLRKKGKCMEGIKEVSSFKNCI